MVGRLTGKVALVTGGASTLGRAVALHFAAEGAKVMVADREETAVGDVAEMILGAGGDASATRVDITDEDQIQSMIGDAIVTYGGLDILVNAAAFRARGDVLTVDDRDWERSLKVNLEGAWRSARYAAPFLKASGAGSMVHLVTTHALRSMPRHFPYSVSKGALLAASRSMAIDFGPQGIRSNVIITGFIQSDHTEAALSESGDAEADFRRVLSVHPLGRVGSPEDVGRAAAFLASDDAAFITGTTLVVDGGRSAVIQDMHNWS